MSEQTDATEDRSDDQDEDEREDEGADEPQPWAKTSSGEED
jgi:hypothetical protein